METRTTKCSSHGEREFLVRCDDWIPAPDVQWLVNLLENSVQQGQRYKDGETLQLGWMTNRVSEIGGDLLLLTEPDMIAFPIQWADGVSQTLRQLRLQKDTAESLGFGEQMQIPSIRQAALVAMDFDQDPENFFTERFEEVARDSGWFIGRSQSDLDYNDPGNLAHISLYAAALRCPGAVPYMFLPTGARVDHEANKIEFRFNGKVIEPSAGSFLKQFLQAEKRTA